jgi:hypothetical protein
MEFTRLIFLWRRPRCAQLAHFKRALAIRQSLRLGSKPFHALSVRTTLETPFWRAMWITGTFFPVPITAFKPQKFHSAPPIEHSAVLRGAGKLDITGCLRVERVSGLVQHARPIRIYPTDLSGSRRSPRGLGDTREEGANSYSRLTISSDPSEKPCPRAATTEDLSAPTLHGRNARYRT